MSDEPLPPCPYCGKAPEIEMMHPAAPLYIIRCSECGIEFQSERRKRAHKEWSDNYNEVMRREILSYD